MKRNGLVKKVIIFCSCASMVAALTITSLADTNYETIPEDDMWHADLAVCTIGEGYVNVRSQPDTGAEIIGAVYNSDICFVKRVVKGEVIDDNEAWFEIAYDPEIEDFDQSTGTVAYVKANYFDRGENAVNSIDSEKTFAKIGDESRIYTKANGKGKKVKVEAGNYSLVEVSEDEYVIDVDNRHVYVSADEASLFIDRPSDEERAEILRALESEGTNGGDGADVILHDMPSVGAPSATSGIRQEVCQFGMQFVGNPYVYGGTDLYRGVDCSSFVQQVLGTYGFALPRVADAQAASCTQISREQLQPGDLVFFLGVINGCYTSNIGHVGVYIGNGQMVHARSEAKGICVDSIDYGLPIVMYGRIIP